MLLPSTSVLQLLYLEALRLRTRELPALEFFKDTLEEMIGLETETGADAFSLIKHRLLAFLGVVFLAGFTAWKAACLGATVRRLAVELGGHVRGQLSRSRIAISPHHGALAGGRLCPCARILALVAAPVHVGL